MEKPDPGLSISKYDKMSKGALKSKLVQTQIELERYKSRKAIRIVDFTIKAFGKVTPSFIKRILRTKVVGPVSSTSLSIKRYLTERSSITYQSQYPYKNLRFFGVGKNFRFKSLVQIIELGNNWQTLRPGVDSADALIIENLSKTEKERLNAVFKEAKKHRIPVISVCHKKEELDEEYVKNSDVVVVFGEEMNNIAQDKLDKNKVCYAGSCFDPVTYSPVGWQENPSKALQVLVSKKLSKEEHAIVKKLSKEFSKGASLEKADSSTFERSKGFSTTLCLPGQFESKSEFEQTVTKLLACGTLVFTTDEEIVSKISVPALALVGNNEVLAALKNPVLREQISVKSRRAVISKYSEVKVFKKILDKAKIDTDINETVSIILCTNRPDYIDLAIKNVASQTYKNLELLFVLHGGNFDKPKIKQKLEDAGLTFKIIKCDENMVFGECLNKGLDEASGQYVAKFDDDDFYGSEHIEDLLQAHEYSQANVVGKWAHFVYLEDSKTMLNYQADQQEKYGGHIPGGTFLIRRSLLEEFRFGRVRHAIDSELWIRLKEAGAQMYSTHRYNYVRVRHGQNTWDAGDEFFFQRSSGKTTEIEPKQSFI